MMAFVSRVYTATGAKVSSALVHGATVSIPVQDLVYDVSTFLEYLSVMKAAPPEKAEDKAAFVYAYE